MADHLSPGSRDCTGIGAVQTDRHRLVSRTLRTAVLVLTIVTAACSGGSESGRQIVHENSRSAPTTSSGSSTPQGSEPSTSPSTRSTRPTTSTSTITTGPHDCSSRTSQCPSDATNNTVCSRGDLCGASEEITGGSPGALCPRTGTSCGTSGQIPGGSPGALCPRTGTSCGTSGQITGGSPGALCPRTGTSCGTSEEPMEEPDSGSVAGRACVPTPTVSCDGAKP
jgi:hypothetical protein